MKTIRIKLENHYEVEVKDDYVMDNDDGEELYIKLEDNIISNNQTINNEFWENLIFVCCDCDMILKLHKERTNGICFRCSRKRNIKK